ncbi:MAG: patatin, partial [Deltaproteobacteria bacterium]|nr:patatin [Deltaproteobacteria bacterium]
AELIDQHNLLTAVTVDGFASTAPLRKLVEQYMGREVLDAIATEYRKGRILLIGTTNLDANRPVLWRIGRIATSESPQRLRLFHDVLIASASIPIAFSPVYIEAVGQDGMVYDEMHVDGGATSQISLYPLGIDWGKVLEKMEVPGAPKLFLINNGKLEPTWSAVDTGNLAEIGTRTIFSAIRSQGIGDLFRLYIGALRDGLEYHLASVPADFNAESREHFDPIYMSKLFDLGYEMAVAGYTWARHPPGYNPE